MYAALRTHGHHSLLTGVDSAARLLARAAELRLPALALCDVDTLSGLHDFLRAGDCGVKRILGAELSDPRGTPGRVIALVRDEHGYRSLCKLVSARQLGGDPGTPGEPHGDPERFELANAVARFQRGLTLLVDHPRLAFALAERVPKEFLYIAIAPGCLRRAARARVERAGPERTRNAALDATRSERAKRAASNTHGDHRGDVDSATRADRGGPRQSSAPPQRVARPGERTPAEFAEDEEARLDAQKVPAPARPASAEELIETARALGLATLAVPDTYYACERGRFDQRLRAAIKHNALVEDLPLRWIASAPGHLPDPAEFERVYEDLPDLRGPFGRSRGRHGMLARTLDVAASCGWLPPLGRVLLPAIELAPGESAYSRLAELAFQGGLTRYRPLRIEVVRRLDYELGAIEQLGYAPYFLLVKRIADWAREHDIPCVGRGSAADSLVAYCLGMTDADPLRYRLPFERFLNPMRKDRPDIDLDFCWRRRDEVLEHVYEAFGTHRTAMIATLNCFGARAAFREAALALGLPPAEVNQVSRRMPHWIEAKNITETLRAIPECRGLPLDDERLARALRAADRLLDEPRHYGLHPGGVVVAPGPITDFVSCRRAAKGCVMTELDKDGVEAVGLVKMDLLGNRALTVIADCVASLRARGIEPAIENVPERDEKTAELLRGGRTLGCNQVESPGMRHLLQQTRAADMDAVIQAVALIRPGPASSGMKDAYIRRLRELEPIVAPHPRLTELLWDTRGVMLYQEDVMQVALHLAGMDLAEADQLRRALQKKRHGELEGLKQRFDAGCAANGVDAASIAKVWELISNFSSFGFCKAHAVTYGRIGYRTVYLKAHWPAAYLVAFLQSETGYYEARVYIEEARRLGVRILGPDLNLSERTYSLEQLSGFDLGFDRADRAQTEPAGTEPASTPPLSRGESGGVEAGSVPAGSVLAGSVSPPPFAHPRSAPARGLALRLGLGQVKGLSEATCTRILEQRARGAILSLPDFLERVEPAIDEAEALIECGALDAFDHTRPELLWRLHLLRSPQRRAARDAGLDPLLLAACRETPRQRAQGGTAKDGRAAAPNSAATSASTSAAPSGGNASGGGWGRSLGQAARALPAGGTAPLFDEPAAPQLALPRLPDLGESERARKEFELLGVAVHLHPVRLFPERSGTEPASTPPLSHAESGGVEAGSVPLRSPSAPRVPCNSLAEHAGQTVELRGWLAASRRVQTSRGEWMRFLSLEDESGMAEVVLFPKAYARLGPELAGRGPFTLVGAVIDNMGACALRP